MFLQRMRRRGRAIAVGTAAVAMAAGCSGSGGGNGGGSEAGTLVAYTGQSGDYQRNFNPYSPTANEGPGTIFEPLFFYNLVRDEEPVPRLGEEFSWNEDGTELTVTVRDDVTFTDGEPFTAEDVAFTFDMVAANPAINQGGYEGEAEAVDDTHVRVTFDEPAYMDAPQLLGKTWIVPEHIWSGVEDPTTDRINEPVGTGPYMLEDFQPQAFTLAANPDYYGGEPAVRNLRYLALSGNQSGVDALGAGRIDWMTGPVPDIQNVEENYPGYSAITVPMNQMALFTCSSTDMGCEGPQTDPEVRRAIYHAMDRTQLNTLAFEETASEISPGFALPERDMEVVSSELEAQIAPMEPDTDEAARLLEDAGWTVGDDGVYAKDGERLSLTVTVPTGWSDYITALNTMSQQLSEIGIELTPQQVSYNEWGDSRAQGQFELLMDSLNQGPAPDPFYVYSYFFSSDTTAPVGETANPNYARYSDPEVDEAIEALRGIDRGDAEARQEHFDTIQAAIAEDMPYIPVLTGGTTSEFNVEKFSGWPTEEDTYAYPAVWGRPDQSQIFLNLTPDGGE
ncbi:peptide/nickel transport system substrate-binding protein [Spinactinospora alkalitolerans]|uniref:Peptide/nickel transport system substrate-binding protein n=1 Tax=Spinactinospora alkalitolerans TaxID=687207 RepID=A0A852TVB2_9ACTN|nr:ABC transporter substrate-binding protein [Spinactinospora alkalitolerans]NYE48416.1 peptide/nickel transport system substrate-binding protein [Spinactinospora alkalitolerans]